MELDQNIFKKRLKELRIEKEITQVELAKKINRSRGCVGHWERGNRTPSLSNIVALSNIFNCSIDYLIGASDRKILSEIHNYTLQKLINSGLIKEGKLKKSEINNFVHDVNLLKELNILREVN